MPDDHDEDYFLPLEDQRVFGAGIRRKRVPFVRSSEHELNTTSTSTGASRDSGQAAGPSIADRYLSIVLPKTQQPEQQKQQGEEESGTSSTEEAHICEICNLPLPSTSQNPDSTEPETETDTDTNANTDRDARIKELQKKHAASLAHQVCLTHSHPPSHLDRTRHGLRYLSAYGWDPDSRLGLGASGREGIREPIRGRLKVDKVGLGVRDSRDEDAAGSGVMGERKRKERERKVRESVEGRRAKVGKQKLNAKEARKGDAEAKKRGERLQEMFYQKEDLGKYLS